MLVKIDGITNKEFSKDNNLFLKFLRENTCSGKVTPEVEVFKGAELSRETFHWVMSTFDTDRDFEKVDQAGWDLKNYLQILLCYGVMITVFLQSALQRM